MSYYEKSITFALRTDVNHHKNIHVKLVLISILLLGLAFAGIAIKILVKKDGKFSGTCASQSPFLNKEGEACGFCGKLPDEQECKNPELSKS